MGSLYSHISKEVNSYDEIHETVEDNQTMKTPVIDLNGQKFKHLTALIDPRSPTMGVSRTPVEVVAERERTKLERARKFLTLGGNNTATGKVDTVEEKTDPNTPNCPNAFLDPRSPTFDYNRTPLALKTVNANTPKGNFTPVTSK